MPASVRSSRVRCVPETVLRGATGQPGRRSGRACAGRSVRASGFSLVEASVVLLLLGITATLSLPAMRTGLDRLQGVAAARHLAALAQSARVRAVMQSVHVGLRFEREGDRYRYALYADGNGNGLRARDVRSGVDAPLAPFERIGDRFPGIAIGIAAGVSEISSGDALPAGADPVRFGASDTLTFTPLGTATSGTLYLHHRSGRQLAVRVLGATGRTRILEFREATGSWAPR